MKRAFFAWMLAKLFEKDVHSIVVFITSFSVRSQIGRTQNKNSAENLVSGTDRERTNFQGN